ncbi:MAG: zinc-binding alcohol dehydrogenase family protein [Devosia sp.]
MHCVVCQKPGLLSHSERPAPVRGTAEVLVRVRRIGICGTDYHIYEGNQPFLSYPRVMGHELAVEVVEAPAGSAAAVGSFAVVNPYIACGKCIACRHGKPNCCVNIAVLGVHRDGGMCEFLSLPETNLIPAEDLSLDACATTEFLAIGAHAVARGQVRPGERILVVGAGPIGLGVALFSRIAGADVTLMDVDAERLAVARGNFGLDSGLQGGPDAGDTAKEFTRGEFFDAVFDATGNAKAMMAGFDLVGHGGRYVLVSIVREAISFSDPEFHKREMTLLASRNALHSDFQLVMATIRSGLIPLDKLITHRTTLEAVPLDLPKWATDKRGLIKAVIDVAA